MISMDDFPADFEDLAKALDEVAPSGWSVGSAEGGWATPSKDEWGVIVVDKDEAKTAESSAA